MPCAPGKKVMPAGYGSKIILHRQRALEKTRLCSALRPGGGADTIGDLAGEADCPLRPRLDHGSGCKSCALGVLTQKPQAGALATLPSGPVSNPQWRVHTRLAERPAEPHLRSRSSLVTVRPPARSSVPLGPTVVREPRSPPRHRDKPQGDALPRTAISVTGKGA